MFGSGRKITALEDEIRELKKQNGDYESKIRVLEGAIYDLEQQTKNTTEKKQDSNEVVKLLLSSYEDGIMFLQNTIEENIAMLSDINTLNTETATNSKTISKESDEITNSLSKIQDLTQGLVSDASELSNVVTSIGNIINLIKDIVLIQDNCTQLVTQIFKGGISRMAPTLLASSHHSLPPILHMNIQATVSSCSKGARGLSVFPRVGGIFTSTTISLDPWLRQLPSRYAIHAGRYLTDKEFRYLRTVIVTAAVYSGFNQMLRLR